MFIENNQSPERIITLERHEKIAAFITDTIKPAKKTLLENEIQEKGIQEFESRPYQLEAWDAIWRARDSGSDRGLLHLATGLGKTSVAVFDYAQFRSQQLAQGKPARGLFVVHQNNILDQANERFGEILPEINRSRGIHSALDPSVDMTFTSFQSLRGNIASIPKDTFDYIIYDEAHHIEAATYKKVVEHFEPSFQLGLTATPDRMDDKNITDHFGEALYSKTLPEAISEGYLATVNYNIVYDDAVRDAMRNDFSSSTVAEIQRLFDVQPRNEVIVDKIREAQKLIRQEIGVEQVKTIIFCADMEHADEIAAMMHGSSYHSGKDSKDQNVIFNSFRNNGLETITVRDMFNEGVDIPDARLIVFLRTTQSLSVFEQQLGRGLRKNKDKQEVTILDFVANIERISMIRALSEEIKDTKNEHEPVDTVDEIDDTEIMVVEKRNSIKVHSEKSEFIFSQEMIDLLEKYTISSSPAPEDWTSYKDTAVILDISDDTVRARLNVLGLKSQYFKGERGLPTQYISPEALLRLKEYTTGMPQGYVSVMDASERLGLTHTTTFSRLKKLGLTTEVFVQLSGQPISAIPEEYIEQLEAYATIPEGSVSIAEAADVLGWDWGTVKKRAQDLQLEMRQYVVNKTGQATSFLTAESLELLKGYGEIPDGYISIQDIAQELGLSTQAVRTRLHYLEIETKIFKSTNRGLAPQYITEKDADTLREYSTVDKNNFISALDAARRLDLSLNNLMSYITDLSLEVKQYPGGNGRPIPYVNVEALDIIRAHRNEKKIEGLFSFEETAEEFGVSDQTIKAWVTKIGLTPHKFQVNGGGRPSLFLTNQDLSVIRGLVAPKGYLKMAEAALRLGIGRNTFIAQVELLGISVDRFMGAQGPEALYISPENFKRVEDEYIIPQGWVSLGDTAKELGISISKARYQVEKLHIVSKLISVRNGRPTPYISYESVKLLK